ncbi:hypothetical protein [Gracilibacillus alcaliphilus]|nr:hypothetical protein [Gracilibacillus alcaliphilus]MBM7679336.1 DNA-directed RNA polymerase subunit RPC12/RpoP [Gracilibacillus alcaliphilus]
MDEYVGVCVTCGKKVWCRSGFLEGVYIDGELYCHTCAEADK